MKQLKNFWVSLALLFTVDANAISIDLIPNTYQTNIGEQVQIAVNIRGLKTGDAPSLGAYDVDFQFDTKLFSLDAIHWGDAVLGNQLNLDGYGSLQSHSLNNGLLNLFEVSFDASDSLNLSQHGDFTLFTLIFNTATDGLGHFFLNVNSLSDAFAKAIYWDSIGTVQITTNLITASEPSTWLLFIGALALPLLRMRRRL
jgi:hypothetical protein